MTKNLRFYLAALVFGTLLFGCSSQNQIDWTRCKYEGSEVPTAYSSYELKRVRANEEIDKSNYWRQANDPPLEFPKEAMEKKREGFVVVSFHIDSTGQVDDHEIVQGCPDSLFNKSASRFITKLEFKPSNGTGNPKPATMKRILLFNRN